MLPNEFPQDLLKVPVIFLAEGLDGQYAMSSPNMASYFRRVLDAETPYLFI